jgi:hypothetical protein
MLVELRHAHVNRMTGLAQSINQPRFQQRSRPGAHPQIAVTGIIGNGQDLDFHSAVNYKKKTTSWLLAAFSLRRRA